MNNSDIRKTAEEVVNMLDEIEECREALARDHCDRNRYSFNNPSDYARAVSAVCEYEKPLRIRTEEC